MISKQTIEEVKNRLIKVYDPLEIYIFGSYAWGHPDEESDLDVLVIVKESDLPSFKRSIEGHRILRGLDLSKDILVYTKAEFELFSRDITRFCYKIKNQGKKIYAKA